MSVSADPQSVMQDALALQSVGRFQAAIAGFDRVLAVQPAHVEAWLCRGNVLMDMDQLAAALDSYDRVLAIEPSHIEALINRSDVLMNQGRPADAVVGYDRVLLASPDFAYAWSNRGQALSALKRYPEALDSYDRALRLDAQMVDVHSRRGDALENLGRHEEAIESCDRALKLHADFAEALNIRGNAQSSLRRFDDALLSYDRALVLRPDYPEALSNRGGALLNLGRHAEALISCDRALAILPGVAEAHNNRGSSLLGLRRFEEALAEFDKALKLKPDSAEMHSNRGNALQGLSRFGEAVKSYNEALGYDSSFADAHNRRGTALQCLDLMEEACASYYRVLELKPDTPWVPGHALHSQMQLSDWTDFGPRLDRVMARLREDGRAGTPFLMQALIDAPDQLRVAAETYAAESWAEHHLLPPLVPPPEHDRLRIAYVSADLGEHPVAYLLAGMLERHDRSRFEVYAISLREASGQWRERIISGVDHFIEVVDKSDIEVTTLLRDLEIDIAVDLNGFTQACRTAIFSERAAPVQVSYIGFLGTMGAPYIDYLIADETIIPQEAQPHYVEKIAYLPTFQMNDDRQEASGKTFTRQALGLPEEGFVFCCFNLNYKITPDVFDSWMRILGRVPGSVLWLYVKSPAAIRNLKAEVEKRGVDADRLIFAPRMPLEDHLARQAVAGLFLDTHPYNAGATASNALRSGLPVLTRMGKSFAARMGGSLLKAAGLPELITHTPQDYEDLAVQLAHDPERLAEIRQKLAANLAKCTLFDTQGSTRSIEAAYVAMHERFRAGQAPDHIYVKDSQ